MTTSFPPDPPSVPGLPIESSEPQALPPVVEAEPEDFLWSDAGAEAAVIAEAESGLLLPGALEEVPSRPRRRWRRTAREVVETLILALLIFLVVRSAVQNFRVEGSSMLPSLDHGEYLIVNKAIYAHINLKPLSRILPFIDPGDDPEWFIFRQPRRGDVVVFRFPADPTRDFIKRIIGEPGDTVEVKAGTVYLNGAPLDEPYIIEAATYSYGPTTVPPKQYFVLGDNRNNSYDSHVWGFVPRENIIGQAWLSYWPTNDFGLVPNKTLEPEPTPTAPAAAVP